MTGPACLVFDPSLVAYDFGPGHPLDPVRVELTVALAQDLGILDLAGASSAAPGALPCVPAPTADDDLVATVHDPELMAAVRAASHDPTATDLSRGLGSEDNPTFEGMHESAAHVVGASVEAARRVWQGEVLHAANIAGGLHHAMPDRVSGFCVYNDVAVAIRWLLDHGAERVAYVDVDVHHGDGVERVFYDDPRVLTVSLHETGQLLFPGTGFAGDVGGPGAEGSAVNVALPPGTSDAGWLRAFHAVVPELVAAFGPQVLVTQHGCDSHADDPLAHLMLTVDGHRATYQALHALAHATAQGRWVATGGGGYSLFRVVPRSWSHLLAELAGHPLDPGAPVPDIWRERAAETAARLAGRLAGRLGHGGGVLAAVAPRRLTDGRTPAYRDIAEGYNPDTWLDRAILETRRAVFPWWGLDPEP